MSFLMTTVNKRSFQCYFNYSPVQASLERMCCFFPTFVFANSKFFVFKLEKFFYLLFFECVLDEKILFSVHATMIHFSNGVGFQ